MASRRYTAEDRAQYWKAQAQGTALQKPRRRVVAARAAPVRRTTTITRAPSRAPARTLTAKKSVRTLSSKNKDESIGHKIGSTIGGIIGHGAQALFTKLTGFGDYTVESNSLVKGGMSPMEIKNTSYNGGVIMRHREYLAPVLATVDFTNRVYPLNPGLSGTFPWVSKPANAFEQWKLRGAIVEYVSTSSDAVLSTNTSSSLGQVMIATQYDSAAEPFGSKMEMLNHEFSNSRKPSVDFVHPIECASSLSAQSIFYVRNSHTPPNTDTRLYDLGLLQIATQGMQAVGGSVGDIYITYEIEFYKACVNADPPVNSILSDHFQISGFSPTIPLGNISTRSSTSSLKGTISADGRRYSFPTRINQGFYQVTINWRGATPTAITMPSPGFTNLDPLSLWRGDTLNIESSPSAGTTSGSAWMSFIVEVVDSGAYFTLGTSGTLPGGANLPCDMFVTQVDSDLVNLYSTEKRKKRRKRRNVKSLLMPGEVFPKPDEDYLDEEEEFDPECDPIETPEEEDYIKVPKSALHPHKH